MAASPIRQALPEQPAAADTAPARVLYVDDDPRAQELFREQMKGEFEVFVASGGGPGLEILTRQGPFPVVVSDLEMIGMNGIVFLSRVRDLAPDSSRVLLTGHANLTAAIAAVNDGQIFRFVNKPCPRAQMLQCIQAARQQYELVVARRTLLEKTLSGSLKAVTDILGLANPVAFGRATRAKERVGPLLDRAEIRERWEVEVAAMLSQIGAVTLPPEVALKAYEGQDLSPDEQAMVDRLPELAANLVQSIPQMEGVSAILRYQDRKYDSLEHADDSIHRERIPWGARALKILLDYDVLESRGLEPQIALDTMHVRRGWYDPKILKMFADSIGAHDRAEQVVRELRLKEVLPGMVFAEDVRARTGAMLIARGQEVTPSLSERIRNMSAHAEVRVHVIIPPGRAA